jgi:hypothetical protein
MPVIVCSVPLDVAPQRTVTHETEATFMNEHANIIIYAIICVSVCVVCILNVL